MLPVEMCISYIYTFYICLYLFVSIIQYFILLLKCNIFLFYTFRKEYRGHFVVFVLFCGSKIKISFDDRGNYFDRTEHETSNQSNKFILYFIA